ncbi:MAG TPA: ATP-dependent Clp protease proteolytic subunit [Fervidobacterium sp.]|nr:ATP-dependent Clp protease proteolytic subunit [Fervidobacterium sp.]
MARIHKDDIDRYHDYDIHVPTRTVFIGSFVDGDGDEVGINHQIAQRTIKNLHVLDSLSSDGDKPINVVLNSNGGDVLSGMAIYDKITQCKNHVTILGTGRIMSISAWIMQAADHRVMTKNSRMMIHTGRMGLPEDHPEINKKWMSQFIKDESIFENILLEKIRIKKPNFTASQVKKLMRFDTILTPDQALDYNLIDEIV